MKRERDKRLVRLLSLVPFIRQHDGIGLKELAEIFEVPVDQLIQDLSLLTLCGPQDAGGALLDISWDTGAVHIRFADYFGRPLRLTRGELMALQEALRHLLEAGVTEEDGLRRALDKLDGTLDAAGPKTGPSATDEEKMLQQLRRAARDRREVDLWYYTYGRDDVMPRTLQPLRVLFTEGNWYLSAVDIADEVKKLFRLDRMRSVELTDKEFEPPEPEEDEGDEVFVFPDPDCDARLRLAKEIAVWAEEQPIFDEVTEDEETGGVICVIRRGVLDWLTRELTRLGPMLEVLDPPELRESIAKRLEGMLAIYEEG